MTTVLTLTEISVSNCQIYPETFYIKINGSDLYSGQMESAKGIFLIFTLPKYLLASYNLI